MNVFAIDTNDLFGFKCQQRAVDYQKYVGKVFVFRKPYGKMESWKGTGYEPGKWLLSKPFVITGIKVENKVISTESGDEKLRRISINAICSGVKINVNFKCYDSIPECLKKECDDGKYPFIENLPVTFVEPFDNFKNKIIGDTICHPIVKDRYEIKDVFIAGAETTRERASIRLIVKNERTGKEKNILYEARDTAPFTDALDGVYRTALYKVERPEYHEDKYGETKVVTDDGVTKYTYVDNSVEVVMWSTKKEFDFILKNVSPYSMKILWNDACYVDQFGLTSKVIHSHIKFSEKENDQPATTILSGAKIVDNVCPSANIQWSEYGEWNIKELFPVSYSGTSLGEVRLMLPIKIRDVVNEYIFVFKVYYEFFHPELLIDDDFSISQPLLYSA